MIYEKPIMEGDEEWTNASLLFHQMKHMQSGEAIYFLIRILREIKRNERESI